MESENEMRVRYSVRGSNNTRVKGEKSAKGLKENRSGTRAFLF